MRKRFVVKKSVPFIDEDVFCEETLSEKVKNIIDKIPDRNLTMSEVVGLLGDDGMLLFAALLAIICLIPVAIPGFSTVFGGVIFFIAISHLLNKNLWLPSRVRSKTISAKNLSSSLNKGLKWFRFLEKISKPHRLKLLVLHPSAVVINSISIIISALLLMLPFGLMPFSNSLPALAILFLTIGIVQKDGVLNLIGYATLLGTFIYYGLFFSTITMAFNKIIASF